MYTYNQEVIARKLFENLNSYLNNFDNALDITIGGADVHWNCKLVLGNRTCEIDCFDDYDHKNKVNAPEYLIEFKDNNEDKAWGRIYEMEEILSSCKAWMSNKTMGWLYENFEFIDWYKRTIQSIEASFIAFQPELAQSENRLLISQGSGLCDYEIYNNNRKCALSGFGVIEPVSFKFYWDDCCLFEVQQNDLQRMAFILKKWLIDNVAPSKLEMEFPEIEVGQLAKYYEKGEGIKGEFLKSWDYIEVFYKGINRPFVTPLLGLIEILRQKGCDETLRAGISLFYMILSRSRRNGLVDGQKFLRFSFDNNKMQVVNELDEVFNFEQIEWNQALHQLIIDLEKTEID